MSDANNEAIKRLRECLEPKGGYTKNDQKKAPRTESYAGPGDMPDLPNIEPEIGFETDEAGYIKRISGVFPEGTDAEEAVRLSLEFIDQVKGTLPEPYQIIFGGMKVVTHAWERRNQGDDATSRIGYSFWWKVIEDKTRVTAAGMTQAQWEEYTAAIKAAVVARVKKIVAENPAAYVLPIGDLQAGQGDGDGSVGLLARFSMIPDMVREDLKIIKATGTIVDKIITPGLGDLIENVCGFYSNQTWLVTLNKSEQELLATRIITDLLIELVKLGLPIHVPVVAGNHGENRVSGRDVITDYTDNADITIFRHIENAFRLNKRLSEQVTFYFPAPGQLSLIKEFNNTLMGFTHGHIAKTSGNPPAKMLAWVKSQATLQGTTIADVDVLVTGHYHHPIHMALTATTTWIQIPACCDESDHFKQLYGLGGGPGFTTFTVRDGQVDHYRVHRLPTLDLDAVA